MAACSAGVHVRRTAPIKSAVSISHPAWTVSSIHQQLYEQDSALHDSFIAAVREFAQDETIETAADAFEEIGMTALDSQLARACQHVAMGDFSGVRWLLTQLGRFGSDTVAGGFWSTIDDIFAGPSQLFAHVEETPTIAIRLPDVETLKATRADHRMNVRRLLGILGEGCRVILTGTREAREFMWADCLDDEAISLEDVTEDVDPRQSMQGPVVDRADAALDDGLSLRKWRLLDALADTDGSFASYHTLYSDRGICSSEETVRVYLGDLEERELVRRQNGTAILTAAGALAVDLHRIAVGDQATISEFSEASGDPPKTSSRYRVSPDRLEDPPGTAGETAVKPGRAERRETGFVSVSYLSPSEHHAAMSAAPSGAVGLVDHPVSEPNSKRAPLVSVNEERGEVVAGGHFYGPLAYLVCLARSLSSPDVLDLIVDRLEDRDGLDQLFDGDRRIYRGMAQGGYLPNEVTTPKEYRQKLEAEISTICELTSREAHRDDNADEDDEEGEEDEDLTAIIMKRCHGLIATITRILECCEIDFSRLVRLPPNYAQDRHTGADGFRMQLLQTLTLLTLRGSKNGAYVTYRTVYEHREKKRKAIAGIPNTTDPGELIGQFCIVGDGATELLSPDAGLGIDDVLADPSLVDDRLVAQEDGENFGPLEVDVGIHRASRRPRVAEVTKRMCDERSLTPTDVSVSVFAALTGSLFDVASAIAHLGTEPSRRPIHLDEVRFALQMLPRDRLLPDLQAWTPRKILACLLDADEPLSQAEIARREGICAASVANNREQLEALALIERTDEGWVFGLPDREERGTRRAASSWRQATPADADADADTITVNHPDAATDAEALSFDHLLLDLVDRDPAATGPPPGVEGGIVTDLPALLSHSPWVARWIDVAAALTGVELDPSAFADREGGGCSPIPIDQCSVRTGVASAEAI